MCCKDFKSVKNKDFETITGIVIKYTYVREGNSPRDPIQLRPIIKDLDSDFEIILNVNGTKLNQTYNFIYLPYTHIAVINPDA